MHEARLAIRARWVDVCADDAIRPGTGVCALVEGAQVAIFRLADSTLHAIDNLDPFSGVHCLSRGIVGDADGVPFVASPVYKQRIDLQTGACLDDDGVAVGVHDVEVRDGRIVARRLKTDEGA